MISDIIQEGALNNEDFSDHDILSKDYDGFESASDKLFNSIVFIKKHKKKLTDTSKEMQPVI